MRTASPTEPELAALRELAAFYRKVIAAADQDHPLISIWEASSDPVKELKAIIDRHPSTLGAVSGDEGPFDLRDPEQLQTAGFDLLARALVSEVEWAQFVHGPEGHVVCGFETGQNADQLFALTARAAQLVAEADGDPAAAPQSIFHDHPFTIILRGESAGFDEGRSK